jgi:formamidopyrimidine-DNA glycosylase
MPEIVEVKKYADFIRKNIKKQKLVDIKIINGRYLIKPFEHYQKLKNHIPTEIEEIDTKGKFMYIKLKNELIIGVTLGLTGGWFYLKNDSNKYKFPDSTDNNEIVDYMQGYIKNAQEHINVEFIFEKGKILFHDQLSFGTIKVYDNEEEFNKKLKLIGIDIMDDELSLDTFILALKKKSNLEKPIGNVLMNQKIISGIGNYLRADTLWHAKISPFRKVKNLTDKELGNIFNSLRLITWTLYDYKLGVENKIINPKDKIHIDLEKEFLIYGKDKDPSGLQVIKEKLYEGSQIRYIYWVKEYQK